MSKIVNFKTREVKDGGGDGTEPPSLSATQEDMLSQLLNYIDLVQNDQLGCLILAGIDKDGLAFTPAIICEYEDTMFKADTLLKEISMSVHERCMDSLTPITFLDE